MTEKRVIPIGAVVRCINEVQVQYGPTQADDVVPPRSCGVVRYRPKDDDPDANFEIGVSWYAEDGTFLTGIEVDEVEVDELHPDSAAAVRVRGHHESLLNALLKREDT